MSLILLLISPSSLLQAIELLRFGADPKIAGSQLQGTPLDVAQKTNQHDFVALFKG